MCVSTHCKHASKRYGGGPPGHRTAPHQHSGCDGLRIHDARKKGLELGSNPIEADLTCALVIDWSLSAWSVGPGWHYQADSGSVLRAICQSPADVSANLNRRMLLFADQWGGAMKFAIDAE